MKRLFRLEAALIRAGKNAAAQAVVERFTRASKARGLYSPPAGGRTAEEMRRKRDKAEKVAANV